MILMHLGILEFQGHENGKINQDISHEEIREAISSTPNFKGCGSWWYSKGILSKLWFLGKEWFRRI